MGLLSSPGLRWAKRPTRWFAKKLVNLGLEGAEAEAAGDDAQWYRSSEYEHLRRVVEENELQGKYSGERCFIMGNGPSLGEMDLTPLAREYTIGMNRIYLMFGKLGWLPTFYICVNPLVIKQSVDEIRNIDTLKFLSLNARGHMDVDPRTAFVRSLPHWRVLGGFSKDLLYGWCEGATVTNCALQFAWYLGFSEVILIGVDHYYSARGRPHKQVTSRGSDPDHFSPDYFGSGVQWQLPDLAGSEYSYRIAKCVYEEAGRKVLDATMGGRLEVFQKIAFEKLF